MRLELPRMGHEVTVCPDGLTAVAALERNTYDCILVDLDMPGLGGIDVIARASSSRPTPRPWCSPASRRWKRPSPPCATASSTTSPSPASWSTCSGCCARVADKRELTNKYRALKQRLQRLEGRSDLIGDSPPMQAVRTLIAKVAPTPSTVMIFGETGTGKELAARAVHDRSPRAEMPLVADQLRGPAGKPHRERTLRPPQRLLHRGRRASRGTVRGGQRRHALPRRDRRAAQGHAGQAAAVPGKRRDPPRGRERVVHVRRPRGLRHPSQPGADGGNGRVPRGPLVPHQHLRDSACRPCASGPRTCRRSFGTWPAAIAPTCRRRSTCSRPRPWPSWRSTPGRGTSASWPT